MSTEQLASIPQLGPLLARSLLRRKRGDQPMADARLAVIDQPVAPDRLWRYQRLCGFRTGDLLPPTFLHLMAFPLSVARMARPDFPFPLLGLVHVGNRLRQHRPVSAAEPVSITAWAADLRQHPAGRQLDLVSEARIGGELVWSETSSYLHREPASDRPARQPARPTEPAQPGRPAGPVIRWPAPADTGRRYAAVSGDRNPIHLHNLTARAFGFRAAIAHGMWLKARTLAAFEGRLPAAYTVQVAFKTPVFLPAELELTAAPGPGGWELDVHDSRSGKPHLVGSIRD